jgi:hypothetical protein
MKTRTERLVLQMQSMPSGSVAERWTALQEQRLLAHDRRMLTILFLERFLTRFFSDKLGVLPGWTNFLDYPLLAIFGLYVLWTSRLRPRRQARTGFAPLIGAFILLMIISSIANVERLHAGAVALFVVGFLEPLAFMYLAYRLGPRPELNSYLVKLLLWVGWLQIIVVLLIDLPIFLATKNPDYISGTFGENAYQMTFYLLAWNVVLLSRPQRFRFKPLRLLSLLLIQGLLVTVILLAQFRAILPFAVFTWIVTFMITNEGLGKRLRVTGTGLCLGIILFTVIDGLYPELKWGQVLQLVEKSDESYNSGKVQSVINLRQLFADEPRALLLGTGPATYASRGFQTFSIVGRKELANHYYQQIFGPQAYITDVAAKYTLPVAANYAFGSATAAIPWFSFLALPAELGLLGLSVILCIYGKAMRMCWRTKGLDIDLGTLARWTFIGMALLLQMAFLGNWLETSRVTVPVWLVFGLLLAQWRNTNTGTRSLS